MPPDLPHRIAPRRLAREGGSLRGTFATTGFARLSSAVARIDSSARVALRFWHDQGGDDRVAGRVAVAVERICQRCLEPLVTELEAEVRLRVVSPDTPLAATAGEEDADGDVVEPFEPWPVAEGSVALGDLLEDELLLALPPAAVHEAGHCEAPPYTDPLPEEPSPSRENPFAALQDLEFTSSTD